MKSNMLNALIFTIAMALCLCGCGGGTDGSAIPQAGAMQNGQLKVVNLYSKSLVTNRAVKIYTPYGYNQETKYPVLYILHGSGSDIDQWMPDLGLNTKADRLIREGKIKPLIIVAPQMDDSYGAGGNEDFLCKDLIAYIESHYSTIPTRENRFIGGLSMGGFIALHNAFFHTDLFSKVGGHSAYLYTKPLLNDSIENPIGTAKYMDLTMLKVYLDTGVSDHYNLTVCLSELYGILKAKGVEAEYHTAPGGHDGNYWSGNADKYLLFYAGIED
jgi:enterochelin esterase-like enzyme